MLQWRLALLMMAVAVFLLVHTYSTNLQVYEAPKFIIKQFDNLQRYQMPGQSDVSPADDRRPVALLSNGDGGAVEWKVGPVRWKNRTTNPFETVFHGADSEPQKRLVLHREVNFTQILLSNGVTTAYWKPSNTELNSPWVEFTSSWWEITNGSLSGKTIKDMLAHNSYYKKIAQNYVRGNYSDAAKLFSPYPEGIDPLPSLAILSDAIVQPDGHAQNGSYFIITKGCSHPTGSPTSSKPSQVYDKLVTIAHFWGEGYYHFFSENLVRFPIAMEYLLSMRESSYMVHVKTRNQFTQSALALLGVPSSRLVDGLVGAKTLYIPEPTPCGTPSAPALRLMQTSLLRAALGGQAEGSEGSSKCLVVVVQRRKAARSISNHEELVKALREGLEGCEIRVHDGKGGVREQLLLFRQAKMVVGPHGAGLSNVISCRVGTIVLEFLPADRHVNICYMAMALKLMLRYIGITSEGASQWGPMTVNVKAAVEMLKKHGSKFPRAMGGRGGGGG